jgi:hypothetical protein
VLRLQEVTFTNTLPLYGANNATFEVVYTLFSGGEQVDTGAAVFTAAKDSLEWAIQIRDWPFAAADNLLLVEFGLGHFSSRGADVSVGTYKLESATHQVDKKLDEYVLRLIDAQGQPGPGLKLIVPLVARIDGAAQPTEIERPVLTTAAAFAQFVASADGGVTDLVGLAAAVGGLVDRLVFRFPRFNATLDYDPNLGLLLNGTHHRTRTRTRTRTCTRTRTARMWHTPRRTRAHRTSVQGNRRVATAGATTRC